MSVTMAAATRHVEKRLAAAGFTGRSAVSSVRIPGRAVLFPGYVLTTLTRTSAAPWTAHVADWLKAELKRLPNVQHVRRPSGFDAIEVYWEPDGAL